jgi:dTDP-glucose 4,6-dehydratase
LKILVTGGAGFIGSNLVRYLILNTDHTVLNLDKLTYAGNRESLADVELDDRYHFRQVDLADARAVQDIVNAFEPDAVMHLAAESHVDRSIDGPGDFIQSNVIGTFNLLQACLGYFRTRDTGPGTRDFRFVHVSTDEVYGSLDLEDAAFTETSRYDPHSPYSASKAASDHLVRAWGDTYGLPVIVTNCSNNYGPYQFPEKLIPTVIIKCLQDEPVPVYGKGENVRDWLFVEDHVEALVTVLTRGRPGETYNIGGRNEWRNFELVIRLCAIMDEEEPRKGGGSYKELITFVEDRPGHDLRYAIDSSKIRTELGWEPHEQFETGFRRTVQWYLDNRLWWRQILSGDTKLQRLGQNSLATDKKQT